MHGALAGEAHMQIADVDDRGHGSVGALLVMIGRRLEGVAERDQRLVAERPPDQLQPDRQAVARPKPAGTDQRRQRRDN